MNVAYLCFDKGIPVLGHKGASVHVREFTQALEARGHRVVLTCAQLGTGNPPPTARLIELVPEPTPVEIVRDTVLSLEVRKIAYNERLADRTLAALAGTGIAVDAVYERSTLFCDAGATIAARARVPRILEVNAPLVHEQAAHRGLHLKTVALEMERHSYRTADHVIAVSSEVAAYVGSQGVLPERITVLPNGVDVDRFSPKIDGSCLRDRLKAAHRPIVGFIGSLKPWHGLDRLLDVFASGVLRPRDPLLVIVGTGPEYERLRNRIVHERLAPRVLLTGQVPHAEIPTYLAAMDLTVAPYEALDNFYFSPMKIVESLAAGRPVVAPDLGQIPSLIAHLETGFVYEPSDPNALADGLACLLDHPDVRSQMGARAAAWARAGRTWARNAAIVEAIFEESIAERAVRHVS